MRRCLERMELAVMTELAAALDKLPGLVRILHDERADLTRRFFEFMDSDEIRKDEELVILAIKILGLLRVLEYKCRSLFACQGAELAPMEREFARGATGVGGTVVMIGNA
ncbi:hypothetical protein GCM10019059_35550 [Camelimonas fluminis]|nr:hypothetical protein GCM10019059_35550 [Camelimonas fluminis]